ncbi:MAG TPA: four helix bundle protein [Nitrospirota bacterium]|nr:four helix bundle protein [Nitrospirota bacterium]
MEEQANRLSGRLLDYGVAIFKLTMKLDASLPGKHIAGQLFRSGTSAGANYEEACGAASRADFIHKLQIVLKELRESNYWLRLMQRSDLVSDGNVDPLIEETKQLINIIAKSLITSKKGR